MTVWDTHKSILKWWKLQNQGDKEHLFILLVTFQHHPGPSLAAGLSWTLATFPWDDTGRSWVSHPACASMLCFNAYYLCISSHPGLNEHVQQSHKVEFTETADTNLPYRLSVLHLSLDTQECGHTGSNSCITYSCTWIIMFSSLRGFLHIANFQEKTKMCSCPVPHSLRSTSYYISINNNYPASPTGTKYFQQLTYTNSLLLDGRSIIFWV